MQLLDGKKVSQAVKNELLQKTTQLISQQKKVPHLAAILVGSNGASETYVASKIKNCEEIGFKSSLYRFEATATEEQIFAKINILFKFKFY